MFIYNIINGRHRLTLGNYSMEWADDPNMPPQHLANLIETLTNKYTKTQDKYHELLKDVYNLL